MKQKEITAWDFQRIMFGTTPDMFLLETLLRSLLIYAVLLFFIRWLGKRMSGQLSINEMAVMLVLGAIVSVPMQEPASGLAQGVLLLICTLSFQRGMSWLGFQSTSFEKASIGDAILLVKDGLFELPVMDKNNITRQLIFSELRQQGIVSLGQVERVYLEATGSFSIYRSATAKPGLSVYPPDDQQLWTAQVKMKDHNVCKNCGFVQTDAPARDCKQCGESQWTNAVES